MKMCEHDVPIEYCGTTKCEITRLRSRVEELEARLKYLGALFGRDWIVDGRIEDDAEELLLAAREAIRTFDANALPVGNAHTMAMAGLEEAAYFPPSPPTEVGGTKEG